MCVCWRGCVYMWRPGSNSRSQFSPTLLETGCLVSANSCVVMAPELPGGADFPLPYWFQQGKQNDSLVKNLTNTCIRVSLCILGQILWHDRPALAYGAPSKWCAQDIMAAFWVFHSFMRLLNCTQRFTVLSLPRWQIGGHTCDLFFTNLFLENNLEM